MPLLPIDLLPIDVLQVLAWFGTASVRVSVFIILLLPLKAVFGKKIRAQIHYLLWCLVFISLLLPWTPSSPVSIYNLTNAFPASLTASDATPLATFNFLLNSDRRTALNQEPVSSPDFVMSGGSSGLGLTESPSGQTALSPTPSGQIPDAADTAAASTVPPGGTSLSDRSLSLPHFLFLLWLTGMAIFAVITFAANRSFIRKIKGPTIACPEITAAFQQARQELALRKNSGRKNIPQRAAPWQTIPLILTSAIKTPSLFGVFRPKLLLPAGVLDGLDREQLRHIFIHELLHLKRNDILVLWLARCLLIVHWFNPLVWYAFRQLRQDQELACDEAVLARLGSQQAASYGLTLVTLWERCSFRPSLVNATTLSGSGSQLKKRIELIQHWGKTSRKWTLPFLALIALLAFVSLSSAMADKADPLRKSSPENPPGNPVIQVNSTKPVVLSTEWVEKARNWQDAPEFAIGDSSNSIGFNDSDIAGIAYGGMLRHVDNNPGHYKTYYPAIDWEKITPAKPLFIKSYEWSLPDYYLVPFVQDGKFVADAVVSVLRDPKGTVRYEYGGPIDPVTRKATADRFLTVDIEQAMQLIREENSLAEAPVPRLIYHSDLTAFAGEKYKPDLASREPAWEFALDDGSRLYVTQSGQVTAEDIVPWYETLTPPPYDPKKTTITANKLQRDDGWHIKVEKIELMGAYFYDPFLQGVQVYCLVENSSGLDELFMPRGTVVGLTSADGKSYSIQPTLLDILYISTQQMRMEQNDSQFEPGQPHIPFPNFDPGQLKICLWVGDVNTAAKQFTALTYRDEYGNEFQIQLNLIPVLAEGTQTVQISDNTPAVEPALVPGKDWGFAVTDLNFRRGDWADQKVAVFHLNIINAKGTEQAFQPTGIITGIIGSSGKFYRYNGPETLEGAYQNREKYFAEKGRPVYRPGLLAITPEILVDAAEKYIAKVVYRDENGQEYQIPLPELKP